MSEEEKKIKKWSNEEKVEALAKFVALRSGDPKKAILYGFMLDCLLDEINKREKKIQKQQEELEKKDKIIDKMAEHMTELDIDEDICMKNVSNTELCNENYSNCKDCIKQYFKDLAEKCEKEVN